MSGDHRNAIATWRQLLRPECEELLASIVSIDTGRGSALARLRRDWSPDVVAAAIELVRARERASRKFPHPQRLVADVAGVEQATSHAVAHLKAERFAELATGPRPVFDLCCGIGGDTMALARIVDVVAVDVNPLRAWMTERNAGCESRAINVENLPLAGEIVHVDPSRRDESSGRRRWNYADYRPRPEFIARLLARCPNSAIKLGPGIDVRALPAPRVREVEFINEGGTLVQAILWGGRLARRPGEHTATRLPDGVSYSAAPGVDPEPADGFDRFLLVPDPALERAGLVGPASRSTAARALHPGLGVLTSPEADASAWFRSFEVLEVLPWRPKRIKAWLDANKAGIVTVKTRGKAVDPDRAAAAMRGNGSEPFTVFGLRLGRKIFAAITRPCVETGEPAEPPATTRA